MFDQLQNAEGKVRAAAVQLVDKEEDGTLRGSFGDSFLQGLDILLGMSILVQQAIYRPVDKVVSTILGGISQLCPNTFPILFEKMGSKSFKKDLPSHLHDGHNPLANLLSGLLVRKFVPYGGQDAQQRVVHGLGGESIQIDDGPFRQHGCRLGAGLFSVLCGLCRNVLPGGLLAPGVLFLYQIDELVAELGLARAPAAVDGHRAKVHLRIQQLDDLFRDALPVEFITVVKGQVFQRNRGLHSSLLEPHPALAGEQLLHERFLFFPQAGSLLFQQHDLPVRHIQHGRNGALLVEGGKRTGQLCQILWVNMGLSSPCLQAIYLFLLKQEKII